LLLSGGDILGKATNAVLFFEHHRGHVEFFEF